MPRHGRSGLLGRSALDRCGAFARSGVSAQLSKTNRFRHRRPRRRVGGGNHSLRSTSPSTRAARGPGFAKVPFLGPVLTQLTPIAPLAIAIVLLAGVWLYRTRTGLSRRVVGESFGRAALWAFVRCSFRRREFLWAASFSGFAGAILSVDCTQTWGERDYQGARIRRRGSRHRRTLEPQPGAASRDAVRSERGACRPRA
jgi:hypothetical protein